MDHRKQLSVFAILLIVYALSAFVTYVFFMDVLLATTGSPPPNIDMSNLELGFANVGLILGLYTPLGLLGYWFARKLDLPGIFVPNAGWRRWLLIPLAIGIVCGLLLVVLDLLFAPINGFGRFIHPEFPVSFLASVSAGIGEEILFRGFFFGLWALLLTWLFRRFGSRFQGHRTAALWTANVIAAIAFAAGHLVSLVFLTGATSLAAINPILLFEVLLLNSFIGLVAGERYMQDGLVAAAGVHFWTDIVWHVFWGLG